MTDEGPGQLATPPIANANLSRSEPEAILQRLRRLNPAGAGGPSADQAAQALEGLPGEKPDRREPQRYADGTCQGTWKEGWSRTERLFLCWSDPVRQAVHQQEQFACR